MKAAIAGAFRGASAPLLWYYAIAVAVPVLNGAPLDEPFLEHAVFVLVVPPVVVTLAALFRGLQAMMLAPSPPPVIAAASAEEKDQHDNQDEQVGIHGVLSS